LSKGILNAKQLKDAKDLQNKECIRLEEAIVKLGYSTYSEITQSLTEQYQIAAIDLNKISIPAETIQLMPVQLVKKHHIIPVSKNNGIITIAVSNPPDIGFIDNLRFLLNVDIKCILAPSDDITNAIQKYYGQSSSESVGSLLKELTSQDITIDEAKAKDSEKLRIDAKAGDDEGPIIQLVSLVINKAIASRASDIHMEPLSNRLRVRYRIDGVCQETDSLPKHLQDSVISRIKILANVDISEKRRPQDGRISLRYSGRDLDVRVSCLPSVFGESVVMRILEKSTILMNLKNLGFCENDENRFHSIINKPNGILLITGPTGSGKTTTLYAVINELNKTDTKIITAEDPIEYVLPGVNQSEVNEKIGFSFPAILRTMLRQDPDVILVGEIRDLETADTAIAAALTGHLVLSTLHTNDAPSAITRLIDMGIKPFLVASSLQGILAQRLVRKICQDCIGTCMYTEEQLFEMGFEVDALKNTTFYKGKGCRKCDNSGYHGRIGIYELLVMNDTLRDMTYRMATTDEMKKKARVFGMTTLKDDGLRKAKDGKTTLEEVFRITGIEN